MLDVSGLRLQRAGLFVGEGIDAEFPHDFVFQYLPKPHNLRLPLRLHVIRQHNLPVGFWPGFLSRGAGARNEQGEKEGDVFHGAEGVLLLRELAEPQGGLDGMIGEEEWSDGSFFLVPGVAR